MPAVANFRSALRDLAVDDTLVAQIMAGYETISDASAKPRRAAFFVEAIRRMDALLDPDLAHAVRDACACSKGGWRLKAAQQIAREYAGRPLEDRIAALNQATHMGQPVLNPDGTITAGIGGEGGLACPCPVFEKNPPAEPVSLTYCYCCAGHFRFHYQIALGRLLVTQRVESSALASQGKQPCRFVYAIEESPAVE